MPFTLTTETIFWALVGACVLAVANTVWLILLGRKIRQLLGGTQAKNIQEALVLHKTELDKFNTFKNTINKYLETVEMRLKRSVQGVETIRFNPFKGTGDGGNQSFSTAFIDESGNGVVVSGLYSRERVSIFSKSVKNYKSEFELSEEEQAVIENVHKKLSHRG